MIKKIKFLVVLLAGWMSINAQVKIGDQPTVIDPASVLEVQSTNKGFLPPRMASGASISNPPKGMVIYNTTLNCIQVNNGTPAAPNWQCMSVASACVVCVATSTTLPTSPVLGQHYYANDDGCVYTYNGTIWTKICPTPAVGTATLTCASGTFAPASFAQGTAYSGNLIIPYTGGNGGTYNLQSVPSTGVTGLTAAIAAGSFATGAGSLVFTVSGTPAASGTASFNINIGGSTCTVTATVGAGAGTATLTCGSAVFAPTTFTQNAAYSGTLTIPYTAGNGGAYGALSVASTGVTGLTAAIAAGSFATGAGSLVFTVSGTPASAGSASFNIAIGGSTCTVTASVAAGAWTLADLPPIGGGISTLISGDTIKTVLSYTGSNQTVTPPPGATKAIVKAWGAGGGGTPLIPIAIQSRGGAGAFAGGTIVNPSGSYVVVVGQGGLTNSTAPTYGGGGATGTDALAYTGGSGGGMSGIFTSTVTQANALLVAGGGGGSAGLAADPTFGLPGLSGHGGAGGAINGFNGFIGFGTGQAGGGGTQTAGGTAAGSGAYASTAGSALTGGQGGNNVNSVGSGGGGGGGYFGGGGGAGHGTGNADDAGGGGGSSYVAPALINTNKVNGDNGTAAPASTNPGNNTDPDYSTGIGVGNLRLAGGNGRVVIYWVK